MEPQRKKQRLDTNGPNSPIILDSSWEDEFNNDQLEQLFIKAEHTQIEEKAPNNYDKKRLETALKTKEGEIAILRSQLNSLKVSRQSESLQNQQAVSELRKKHREELESVKKTVNELKDELEFKNLEIKGLSDTVKQLDSRSNKVNFVEPCRVTDDPKKLFSLSQAVASKTVSIINENPSKKIKESKESCFKLIDSKPKLHGERLSRLIVSGFFKKLEESTVVLMYDTNPVFPDGFEHLRQEKLKWAGLPTLVPRLQLMYPLVNDLYKSNIASSTNILQILQISKEILSNLKDLLVYLVDIPINLECEEKLVGDTSLCPSMSLSDLLSNQLVKPIERGTEARRCIALGCCLIQVFEEPMENFASKEMLSLFGEIIKLIDKIRRPLEFSGVLAAILMYLQALFQVIAYKIEDEMLHTIKQIIFDVIFCRPKLNVLREVIKTLTFATKYSPIFHDLCKQSSADSCALYMDSRFTQALFFTSEACPLKLLQVQVKPLVQLCGSKECQQDITQVFINWFQCITLNAKETVDWLVRNNEQCCDIMECFCHLLTLVVTDAKSDKVALTLVEKGVMILRDCCKISSRKMTNGTLQVLPFYLKSSGVIEIMEKIPREAADWLLAEYEGEVQNHESSASWCSKSNST